MMDFSESQCPTTTSFFDSDSEEDDDFLSVSRGRIRPGPTAGSSLSPSFGTWNSSFNNHGSSAEVCKNGNGRYDRTSLIAKINKIIEESEKSILHAVEVAGASVTQLESRTRQLENSMDDLKVCVEYNHGRTGGNLRELENILKEVHMDAKYLLDKQEIAETELQLLKLQRLQKPSISVLDSRTSAQPATLLSSANANLPHPNHPSPQAPLVPSISQPVLQNVSPYLTQASELSSPTPHETYHSNLVHPQALSAPNVSPSHLPPCFTSPPSQYTPNRQQYDPKQSTLYSFRVSDRPSVPANTKFVPPSSSFSGFPNPSSHKSYNEFASSHALPKALPRASFLDTQAGSSGKANKASNEDIAEEVAAMGFRRDMVIAAVRKLTQKQESVDLNTLLDKLMN